MVADLLLGIAILAVITILIWKILRRLLSAAILVAVLVLILWYLGWLPF